MKQLRNKAFIIVSLIFLFFSKEAFANKWEPKCNQDCQFTYLDCDHAIVTVLSVDCFRRCLWVNPDSNDFFRSVRYEQAWIGDLRSEAIECRERKERERRERERRERERKERERKELERREREAPSPDEECYPWEKGCHRHEWKYGFEEDLLLQYEDWAYEVQEIEGDQEVKVEEIWIY